MLWHLAGDVSEDKKTKSDCDLYEKLCNSGRQVNSNEESDSSSEPSDPNAKEEAVEAEKYSSNSPEETHISTVLKFHYIPSSNILSNFFFWLDLLVFS